MKRKISNQYFLNYLVVFVLVIVATVSAYYFLILANQLAAGTFTKNRYPANAIVKDDYKEIDAAPVVQNGGSVQVIDKEYRVVVSEGLDSLPLKQLTPAEFTEFLVQSKSKESFFHHDVLYNPRGEFWLIVTFPTSLRIDLEIVWNPNAATGNFSKTSLVFAIAIGMYLLMLAVLTMLYSRITASHITRPLRKLCEGTRLLREGDYSARVDLRLNNEFAELQNTFNDMAARIEREISLRKKSEEDRKRLILDISHDLKNPMSSIQGYAELLMQNADLSEKERSAYLQIIHQNSKRATGLLSELFELSRMDSAEFSLKPIKADLCESLRQICGELVPHLEHAGFEYEFDIPEESIHVLLDTVRFTRLIQNLADNALKYNSTGTTISVSLKVENHQAMLDFYDDGIGIPAHLSQDIFKPFVRADDSRNSQTGGSGLGLSIAKKIAEAHGGALTLSHCDKGCNFRVMIPTI